MNFTFVLVHNRISLIVPFSTLGVAVVRTDVSIPFSCSPIPEKSAKLFLIFLNEELLCVQRLFYRLRVLKPLQYLFRYLHSTYRQTEGNFYWRARLFQSKFNCRKLIRYLLTLKCPSRFFCPYCVVAASWLYCTFNDDLLGMYSSQHTTLRWGNTWVW